MGKHFNWAPHLFTLFRGAVAFIETVDGNGDISNGTCFHVGDGSFVTAKHVVEGRTITKILFDDYNTQLELMRSKEYLNDQMHGSVTVLLGPYYHKDSNVDVSCFKATPYPKAYIPLGGHLDDWLGQYDLVLERTLILGYPPIPFSDHPVLVATVGEVNAIIDKYTGGHPHFIISATARGGFSGAPALIGYSERIEDGGTATLGLVTESLTLNGKDTELGYLAVLNVEPIFVCLADNGLLPAFQNLGDFFNSNNSS